jgi:hypothetical protein
LIPFPFLVLGLLGYSLIVGVATYPHPYETILIFYRKGAMRKTDPCGPELPYFLELKRRMPCVFFQKLKAPIGCISDIFRQGSVPLPELVGGSVH